MVIRPIISQFDQLPLEAAFFTPVQQNPKAVICFSHGMAEHKERYYPFIEFLCANGYACVIHDHRGHGASVRSASDLGYFYTEDISGIVDDLATVIEFSKQLFPSCLFYLFSHSMGTLVARNFMKKYGNLIHKVVLCGPPTRNNVVDAGLFLAKAYRFFGTGKKPNEKLNSIAFKGFNDGNTLPNGWLSYNPDNVKAYNADPLCGFTFTTNGFINLFKLQKGAFVSDDWLPYNYGLPIFIIAGEDDPCIGSKDLFLDLQTFLQKEVRYLNVTGKLYPKMRHEILNETEHDIVYQDVLRFFNS